MLKWVSDNPAIATAVISVVASVLGAVIASIFGPWVGEGVQRRKEAREEERRLAEERRKLIASWRNMVSEAQTHCEVTNKPTAFEWVVGKAEFQSLEAHAGRSFRGGVSVRPALYAGSRMPPPLEDLVQAIEELEVQWKLRPPTQK